MQRHRYKMGVRSTQAQALLSFFSQKLLYDYQSKFIDDESRFRVVLKSRQVGMSTGVALEATMDCILNDGSTVLFISRSLPQSVELLTHAKNEVLIPLKQAGKIQFKEEKELVTYGFGVEMIKTKITFTDNNSRIISLSSNPDTHRAYTGRAVYVDEAAIFKKGGYDVQTSSMGCLVRGGRLTLLSTPKGRHGWLADVWYEAWDMEHSPHDAIWKGKPKPGHEPLPAGVKPDEEDENFRAHCIHYSQCPHLPPKIVNPLIKNMGVLTAKQEMGLIFLEAAETLFTMDQILDCTEEYRLVPYHTLKPKYPIVMAIDFGRYRDSTVITIWEIINGHRWLRYIAELQITDIEEQIGLIGELISVWSPYVVIIDKTGMGIPIYDRLHGIYRDRISGYTIGSAAKKEALVKVGHPAILAQTIHFPNCEATKPLINQLHTFQRIQDPKTGHIKYEHPYGEHDDYVISAFLGIYATAESGSHETDASEWSWQEEKPKLKKRTVHRKENSGDQWLTVDDLLPKNLKVFRVKPLLRFTPRTLL